ncbi:MAG: VirB3 family type IV secretion system protein [Burkholderiales bacterium]|nr:VirB3 family type IV secretion system protein [Burkholderiales bacterium]
MALDAAPLFKGATRVPLIMGIPMFPFMVATGGFLLAGFWINMLILLGFPVVFWIMRMMTSKDDQIFTQLGTYLMFYVFQRPLHGLFGSNAEGWRWPAGVTSFAPCRSNDDVFLMGKPKEKGSSSHDS